MAVTREHAGAPDSRQVSCVVCAVDESEPSRQAALVADRIARDRRARLVLVQSAPAPRGHVYGVAMDTSEEEQERIAEAQRMLGKVAGSCHAEDVSERFEFGPTVDVLLRVLAEENAELLVLGARQRGAVRSLLSGSLAHKMIEISPCPVLVVPA
jgi:nucleotide-binding universal stress UspA family protein